MTTDKQRFPKPHKFDQNTWHADYSPSLLVSWYADFDYDRANYYGQFTPDQIMPRYADEAEDGQKLLFGPVSTIDNHYHDYYGGSDWLERELCYASYGDPRDTVAHPPPAGTDYHRYNDAECFVYGEASDLRPTQLEIVPEDARAIICEVNPIRVNHITNPQFVKPINIGTRGWRTSGHVQRVNGLNGPYGSTGLLMFKHSLAEHGSFGDYRNAIYVGNTSPDGTGGQDASAKEADNNWWRISFMTNVRSGVYGGYKVLRSDGTITYHTRGVFPMSRPWDEVLYDREDSLHGLDISISLSPDPSSGPVVPGGVVSHSPSISHGFEDQNATPDINTSPYSRSGWYCYYSTLNLGANALWALPFVGVNDVFGRGGKGGTALITSVIAERWDSSWTLEPRNTDPRTQYDVDDQGGGYGRFHSFLRVDPLIYFDGDGGTSKDVNDFIWYGDPNLSASGYYPQRYSRVSGLKHLMRAWLPLGRPFSVRYVHERP